MFELTSKRVAVLLWILENKKKKWSIFELQRESRALGYGSMHSFVKELERNGFIVKDSKTNEYGVSRALDLIKLLSLSRPFHALKAVHFFSPLGFFKTLKLFSEKRGEYCFSVFAGSELFRQYVKTDQVHVYVLESEVREWEKFLVLEGCLKAEKSQANLFLIPASDEFLFKQAIKIKGFKVVPVPILLSDLLSFGGLAEEQGNFLLEKWLNDRI